MFPSKGMDYTGDMYNYFSKTRSMEGDSTFNYAQSPIQSAMVNRSSSSADSTSPESYPDNSVYIRQAVDYFNMKTGSDTPKLSYESPPQINCQYESFTNIYEPLFDTSSQNLESPSSNCESFFPRHESPSSLGQTFNTPIQTRFQKPIFGRKILGRNLQPKLEAKTIEEEMDNLWQEETLEQTAPEVQKHYELFPSNRRVQLTSVKPSNLTPGFNRNIKNMSPVTNSSMTYTPSMTNSSDWSSKIQSNIQPNFTTPFQPAFTNTACLSNNEIKQTKMCTFCRKNGETPVVYTTHYVKEKFENVFIVTCPILRSHVCSICGSSGDNAHTLTYCPILRRSNDGKPLKSTTVTLKNTRIKSNGRRRY